MKALILAAGLGSRLLGETRNKPKCLVTIIHDIINRNFSPEYTPFRPNDTIRRRPDISKASEVLDNFE